ncbi:hypothetical protein Btru_056343 [Bulinus truncatus]|nr:hypothetical protein Btru_056343 [Bulinus truncatus]
MKLTWKAIKRTFMTHLTATTYTCLKTSCTAIDNKVTDFIKQFDITEPLNKICQTCGASSAAVTGILLGLSVMMAMIG